MEQAWCSRRARSLRGALLLAALLAARPAGAAAPDAPADLVLAGERALVALFPPLAGAVDNYLNLATFTCEAVPLVSLLAGSVSVPPLTFVEYSARGARDVAADAAAAEAAASGAARGALALYVGGWGNAPRDDVARGLAAALLPTHARVLALDTRDAFRRSYVGAAARVAALAARLAAWLRAAAAAGARVDSWHVVGFSLGAHVAAHAAGAAAAAGARVARLTALEPARQCTPATGGDWRRGARLVTVVHTSRVLALWPALGHADVYVAGVAREGCGAACQHAAAWRLWALSARDAGVLRARRCADAAALAAERCEGAAEALGVRCARRPRGLYLYTPPASMTLHDLPLSLYPDPGAPDAAAG